MKFALVTFPDTTDTSSLIVDGEVTVGLVTGGIIASVGTMQNTDKVEPELVPHTHSLDAPGADTGPAEPTVQ